MLCTKCGRQRPENPTAVFCSSCGVSFGQGNGQSSSSQEIIIELEKSAALAGILSFLCCGLGQIYNGQLRKGILLAIAYVFSYLLMFVFIGFVTTPILWAWGIIDAYRTAERLNREARAVQGATQLKRR